MHGVLEYYNRARDDVHMGPQPERESIWQAQAVDMASLDFERLFLVYRTRPNMISCIFLVRSSHTLDRLGGGRGGGGGAKSCGQD